MGSRYVAANTTRTRKNRVEKTSWSGFCPAHLEDVKGTPDQVTNMSFGPAAAASTTSGAPGALRGTMDVGVVEDGSPHPTIWFLENTRTKYSLPVSRSVISYSPP